MNGVPLFCHLPQVKSVEVFKEFYQTKTKHRKLTWIYSLGTCNINGKFVPKTIELIVGTYQVTTLSNDSIAISLLVTIQFFGFMIASFSGCCSVTV